MPTPQRHVLVVTAAPGEDHGVLAGPLGPMPCRLGRNGICPGAQKREGDGATPAGLHALRQVYFRPDRLAQPRLPLPVIALDPLAGWCDDPQHVLYNRPVRRPFAASHEALWRTARVYDLIVVLDYNLEPAVPGRGSAIFLHQTTDDLSPGATEGCVALAPTDLARLLPLLAAGSKIEVRHD